MKNYSPILTILFLFFITSVVEASHIVGGYIRYDCVSPGKYKVKLTVYRNCNSQSQDNFDFQAPITIWKGNTDGNYMMVENRMVQLNSPITNIPILIYNPCIVPPNDFCVEEGTYDFEIDLPISNESYHITYQRCCRNWNIANIVEPRYTGSTFTVEITPRAQQYCNSTPDFVGYPPPLICAKEAWFFDHSATDSDGDQLVYEFCAPLQGAGIVGAYEPGDPTGCDGYRPNPGCAPPYFGVEFKLPEYSAQEPMGGSPTIIMNPFNGEITGTPNFQGQYSIGVCVSEYRNGELLSRIRRDIQFTVVECVQLVQAILSTENFELENNTYKIKQCGAEAILIDNASIGQNFIDEFYWELNGPSDQLLFNTWDLNLGLLEPGHYDGILHLNPGASGCNDSTFLDIDVFENPVANFIYSYDTCSIDPISFSNASLPFGGPIGNWDWNFGQEKSEEEHPVYQFPDAGNYSVELKVADVNNCKDSINKTISWFPAPEVIVVEPNSQKGCPPLNIEFVNLSWPIDETYQLNWTFEQAGSSDQISPFVSFEEVDVYDVSLQIISPFNCEVQESWPDWITVHPKPISSFEITKSPENILEPFASYETTSPDGKFWDWEIPGMPTQYGQQIDVEFPDTGYWSITHIVENEFSCFDTLVQQTYVEPYSSFFLPNAFSPNNDGKNEFFIGTGTLQGARNFSLKVWNRFGELIFESSSPDVGWNGRKKNIGKLSPIGSYPYELQYVRYDNQLIKENGMVILIK